MVIFTFIFMAFQKLQFSNCVVELKIEKSPTFSGGLWGLVRAHKGSNHTLDAIKFAHWGAILV